MCGEHGQPSLDQLAQWFDASLEEAWTAIYCLAARPAFDDASWRLVERWSGMPDTWAIADPLALILVAGHLEAGVLDEDRLHDWAAREEPFWFRRVALVATTSPQPGTGRADAQTPAALRAHTANRPPSPPGAHARPVGGQHPRPSPLHPARHRLGAAASCRRSIRTARLRSCSAIASSSPRPCCPRPGWTTTGGVPRDFADP